MIATFTLSTVLMSGLALAGTIPAPAPATIALTTDFGCVTQADLGKGRPNVQTTKIFCVKNYPLGWPSCLEKTLDEPFTLYTDSDPNWGWCENTQVLPKCQLDVLLENIPKGTTELNYRAKERCLFDQHGKKLDKLCCLAKETRVEPVLNPYLALIPQDIAIQLCQEGTNGEGSGFTGPNDDY